MKARRSAVTSGTNDPNDSVTAQKNQSSVTPHSAVSTTYIPDALQGHFPMSLKKNVAIECLQPDRNVFCWYRIQRAHYSRHLHTVPVIGWRVLLCNSNWVAVSEVTYMAFYRHKTDLFYFYVPTELYSSASNLEHICLCRLALVARYLNMTCATIHHPAAKDPLDSCNSFWDRHLALLMILCTYCRFYFRARLVLTK